MAWFWYQWIYLGTSRESGLSDIDDLGVWGRELIFKYAKTIKY